MGANSQKTNSLEIDFSSDYTTIKTDHFGQILEHKQSNLTYFLREFTYSSDADYQTKRKQYQRQQDEGNDSLLSVEKVKTHTIFSLCSTAHKIFVLYQYPQVTLLDEIEARRLEGKKFEEAELWSLIQSCNLGLAQLPPSASLNPSLVFITRQGTIKVIHRDLLSQTYRIHPDPSFLYSPEKMRNFSKLDNQLGLIRQAIFSFGMTILQAALLQPSLSCYDFDKMQFFEKNLVNLIETAREQYSRQLISLLTQMLSLSPCQRPAYHEIQLILDGYWTSNPNDSPAKLQSSVKSNQIYQQVFLSKPVISFSKEEHPNTEDTNKNIDKVVNSLGRSNKENMNLQNTNKSVQIYSNAKRQGNHLNSSKRSVEMSSGYNKKKVFPSNLKASKKQLQLKPKNGKAEGETDEVFAAINDIQSSARPNQHLDYFKKKIEPQRNQQTQNQKASVFSNFPKQQKPKSQKAPKTTFFKGLDKQGRQYEGGMLNDMKQGIGKLIFHDGAFYEGQFREDNMSGRGTLYYNIGKPAYDGFWSNDSFHGKGKLYSQFPQTLNGTFDFADFDKVEDYWVVYEGEFYQDCKQGRGKLLISNGQFIQGTFSLDSLNGECTFYRKDGRIFNGIWRQNKLQRLLEKASNKRILNIRE